MKRIIPFLKRLLCKQSILYIQIEKTSLIMSTLKPDSGTHYTIHNISRFNLNQLDLHSKIIFNSSKITNMINSYLKTYHLTKPQAILCAPHLDHNTTTLNLLSTLNTTLIFSRCPIHLKSVINRPLINKEGKGEKNDRINLAFFSKQTDILIPFKHYNQHHPSTWLIATWTMAIFTTWYLCNTSFNEYKLLTKLRTENAHIEKFNKTQNNTLNKIKTLKQDIAYLVKKTHHAQPALHALKPETLLKAISTAIPLKTYLTHLSITQDEQVPKKYNLHMNGISLAPQEPSLFIQKLNKLGIIKNLGLKRVKKRKTGSPTEKKVKSYTFESHGSLFA